MAKNTSNKNTRHSCWSQRRNLANSRERKRMMLINQGFELLRSRLPEKHITTETFETKISKAGFKNQPRSRLTKVDILRQTIDYINQLTYLNQGIKLYFVNETKMARNERHREQFNEGLSPSLDHSSQSDQTLIDDGCEKVVHLQSRIDIDGRLHSIIYRLSISSLERDEISETRSYQSFRIWIPTIIE